MSDLFCLYCQPTMAGTHQEGCRLANDKTQEVLEKYDDLVARFAKISGMSEAQIKKIASMDMLRHFVKEGEKND